MVGDFGRSFVEQRLGQIERCLTVASSELRSFSNAQFAIGAEYRRVQDNPASYGP